MRLGTYLFALFLPPVYLFTRGRVLAGLIAGGLCGVALLLFLTIFLAPVGLVFWLCASLIGIFEARKQFLHEHAEMLATKMAEKMQKAQSSPPMPPK